MSTGEQTFPSSDGLMAEKAAVLIRSHPSYLPTLATFFTPTAASSLLRRYQSDQTLTLAFLSWARPHPFFDFRCKCLSLHLLARFGLFKFAQSIAEDLSSSIDDDLTSPGSSVFLCLKDSYYAFNSSSAVFDLVVKSFSSVNMPEKALNFLNLTRNYGFMPGVISYNAILDAMIRSKGSMAESEDFYLQMIDSSVSPNVYTFNIRIRGFCEQGDLARGLSLLEEMVIHNYQPNVVTFNTLIHSLCKNKRLEEAISMFRSMSIRGVEPNLRSYNVIINGLCGGGRTKDAPEVLDEMYKSGLVPDEVTFNTLLHGYCREGDLHQALFLHEKMLRDGVPPNVITYTALINTTCKAGNLNRSMAFLHQMELRGLLPNQRTYTTLVNGFCQKGLLDEAHQMLNRMNNRGFSPSIVTYNAIVNGHCIAGDVNEALMVMKEMETRGLNPDIFTHGTIISSFCKMGDMSSAFGALEEMVDSGISPDRVIYSSIIHGLCSTGRIQEASHFFQEMVEKKGLPPDEIAYTSLISGYCIEGEVDRGFLLLKEMMDHDFIPDVTTYSVLIKAINKKLHGREARKLLFKLMYEEPVAHAGEITFRALADACESSGGRSATALMEAFCAHGIMEEAERVFEYRDRVGCGNGEAEFDALVGGYSNTRNATKAYGLYRRMAGRGFVPCVATAISLAKALRREGKNSEVGDVVSDLMRSCRLGEAEVAKTVVEVNRGEGNLDAVFNVISKMAKDGLLPRGEITGRVR